MQIEMFRCYDGGGVCGGWGVCSPVMNVWYGLFQLLIWTHQSMQTELFRCYGGVGGVFGVGVGAYAALQTTMLSYK